IAILTHIFLYVMRIFPNPMHFFVFTLPLVAIIGIYFRNQQIAKTIDSIWKKFVEPFHVNTDIKVIQIAIDIARIVAGLAILFMFLDSLSYALLLDADADKIYT